MWAHHVAGVFDQEARERARRLVAGGELPGMVIGEWWTDRPHQAQIDVVGVAQNRWQLASEVKWSGVFTVSHLRSFERHLAIAPRGDGQLAVWTRGQVAPEVRSLRPGLLVFGPGDVTTC